MKPEIHFFQHVSFEGVGCIEDWIKDKGYKLTGTRFYENDNLPALSDFDWLIIMGGPMSVYDDERFGWLKQEKIFIKSAIDSNKKVLGICLGAQLIAAALGAKVFPNAEKEIGWFPVQKDNDENILFHDFPSEFTVFHWHGDTFDLPDGATNLLSSKACGHQAFAYKKDVLALQFHFEVTEQSLGNMIMHGSDELVSGKYIQLAEEIVNGKKYINENNARMFQLLNKFTET